MSLFTIGVRRLPFSYRSVSEADVGADHPRQLKWESSPEQKRSIGVRMPSSAAAASTGEDSGPQEKSRRCKLVPRGSVKEELEK